MNSLGQVLWNAGRANDALAIMRRAYTLDPNLSYVNRNLGRFLLGMGRYAEAEAFLEESGLPADSRSRRVARALAARDSAAAIEAVRADRLDGSDYYLSALVGDRERTLSELALGIYGGPFGRPDVLWDPVVESYRDDPRFRELVRNRNLEPR